MANPKKRVLFVDDDPLLLRVYELMLSDDADAWEVVTACDGERGLECIRRQPFDIVVSDMRMPGVSGTELMHEVRKIDPSTSRVILSGLQDQKEIAESLQATHQFVAKPFHPRELKATLEQLGRLKTLLADKALQSIAGHLNTLPSFPAVYLDVIVALSSEDASMDQIGEIISRDPALVAKLLQVANSAAFGLMKKVSSPTEAVQFLGFSTVRALTLSVHVFANFIGIRHARFSAERLCDHSMRTAQIARAIMQAEGATLAEIDHAYTAGMLHDVGKLVLAQNLPDQFQQALQLADQRRLPAFAAEREVFGTTHAAVGAYLLGLWGLPGDIVEGVAFHSEPPAGAFTAAGAVHIASALEHEAAGNSADAALINQAFLHSVQKAAALEPWRAYVAELPQAHAPS